MAADRCRRFYAVGNVKSLRLATEKFIELPKDIDDDYVNRFIGGLWKCAS